MSNDGDKKLIPSNIRGILSGTASGVAKLVVGHPFDTLKVRLQTEGGYGRFRGFTHCVTETLKTEGIRGLYKGGTPPLIGWGIVDSVMVGVYAATKRALGETSTNQLPISNILLAGMIGGWASVIVVTPIEGVKARLQVQYADPLSKVYSGPIDCIRSLVRNNGIAGLYKGFWPTVMFRTGCSVYFGSYEWFKRKLAPSGMAPMFKNFISGGCAATTLWIFFFPFDVVKNRMMAQPDRPDRPYKTVTDCFRQIWRKEGAFGFYRGFTPCLLRSFPTNGAAFVAIELTTKYLP